MTARPHSTEGYVRWNGGWWRPEDVRRALAEREAFWRRWREQQEARR